MRKAWLSVVASCDLLCGVCLRIHGLAFMVPDSWSGVHGSGFMIRCLWFIFGCSGFTVWCPGSSVVASCDLLCGVCFSFHVKLFRGGLAFKAHRPLFHSPLGSKVMMKKKIHGAVFRV